MCGRFKLEINPKDIENFYRLIETLNQNYNHNYFETRDFHPSQLCPVITKNEITPLKWGFPMDKKLIINARSEGISEKNMFSMLLNEGKCIIPANSFYEWNNGSKFEVKSDEEYMFFAGVHRKYLINDVIEDRFVIITAASNHDMAKIHPRMPVIIDKKDVSSYLNSDEITALNFLNTNNLKLDLIPKDDFQLSFF